MSFFFSQTFLFESILNRVILGMQRYGHGKIFEHLCCCKWSLYKVFFFFFWLFIHLLIIIIIIILCTVIFKNNPCIARGTSSFE
jgi:hypothetical protein